MTWRFYGFYSCCTCCTSPFPSVEPLQERDKRQPGSKDYRMMEGLVVFITDTLYKILMNYGGYDRFPRDVSQLEKRKACEIYVWTEEAYDRYGPDTFVIACTNAITHILKEGKL